ncbi:hypothetical protein HUJ04_007097 [Dendroctonus ponderosae]|nr:hypothetical protein HUJ04_007097 [Dendroctonus ponderosae]
MVKEGFELKQIDTKKTLSEKDLNKIAEAPTIGVRHAQVLVLFLLIFLAYGIRVTLSVAIVAMTDPTASSNPNVPASSKWFLMGAMGICGTMCILLPAMAAAFGSKGVMINRALQGLCQGFLFPNVHHALSQWVPPDERSRLGTIVYAAGPFGTVIAMLLTGIISASYAGWPLVFYVYGGTSVAWTIICLVFTYNSPAVHPRISEAEKFFIEYNLGHSEGKPNSILSALPYFVLWILSFIMSFTSDSLITRRILSIGNTRKVFNSIGLIIPAIALVFLGFTPSDDPKRAVALLVVAVGFNSGIFCGFNVNHVDISPNHAGILMGITNGISNIFGIVAPLLVQFLVSNEDTEYTKEESSIIAQGQKVRFGARHVQFIFIFGCLTLSIAMRASFSIAIVAMTDNKTTQNHDVPTYSWNNTSVMLSSFFWSYIIFQVFAGYVAKKYGPKYLLLSGSIVNALSFSLIPVSAKYASSDGVIAMRVIQGSYGLVISFMILAYVSSTRTFAVVLLSLANIAYSATLVGYSVNHVDLSPRFAGILQGISNAISQAIAMFSPLIVHFLVKDRRIVCSANSSNDCSEFLFIKPRHPRSTIGSMLSSIIPGYLSTTWWGWPSSFYVIGAMGMLWCVLFLVFGRNSPASHPKITAEEKRYIQMSLNQEHTTEVPIPLKQMATSVPVLCNVVAQIGIAWSNNMALTEYASYLDKVMNFDIKSNGLYSAIPPGMALIAGLIFGPASDYAIMHNYLSTVNSRRLFHLIGGTGISISIVSLSFLDQSQKYMAILLMVCIYVSQSAMACGNVTNMIDLSPRFAGIIFGSSNAVGQSIGLFAPILVQLIVTHESDITQWRIVFIITAGIIMGTSIVFVIFASGDRQPWDGPADPNEPYSVRQKKISVISMT